jgi:hypothetical protein
MATQKGQHSAAGHTDNNKENSFRPLKETKAQVLPPMAILVYSRM